MSRRVRCVGIALFVSLFTLFTADGGRRRRAAARAAAGGTVVARGGGGPTRSSLRARLIVYKRTYNRASAPMRVPRAVRAPTIPPPPSALLSLCSRRARRLTARERLVTPSSLLARDRSFHVRARAPRTSARRGGVDERSSRTRGLPSRRPGWLPRAARRRARRRRDALGAGSSAAAAPPRRALDPRASGRGRRADRSSRARVALDPVAGRFASRRTPPPRSAASAGEERNASRRDGDSETRGGCSPAWPLTRGRRT